MTNVIQLQNAYNLLKKHFKQTELSSGICINTSNKRTTFYQKSKPHFILLFIASFTPIPAL